MLLTAEDLMEVEHLNIPSVVAVAHYKGSLQKEI